MNANRGRTKAELLDEVQRLRDRVAELERAEEALRHSEQRFQLVVRATNDAIWDWDLETGLVWWNEGVWTLFGYAAGEVGHDAAWRAARVHPEDRPRVVSAVEAAVEGGRSFWADEYRFQRADGTYAAIFDRGYVLRDARGRPLRMIGAMADVTARKNLEEELRRRVAELAEADRQKDEFLAMLAHELRNPLAPLRNALHILKLSGAGGSQVERLRGMMERQVHQMVRLVDDLLDVSRIMRGKIELRMESVKLSAVLGRAVETTQPLIDSQGHHLTVEAPDDAVVLHGDLVRLAQVFANLLNNAAKYTPEGGDIHLSARVEGNEVLVRVRDNGVGIAADLLPRVFDLFVQADRSASRAQGGLGVGLTLVRRLVQMHGGTVSAASPGSAEGLAARGQVLGGQARRGSEFTVRLPVADREPRKEAKGSSNPQSAIGNPQSRRVLVVDDNVDAAESLEMLLRLAGHEVRAAHTGPAGVAAVDEFRPEVVLLDIGLPGVDGYEIARQLRGHPARPGMLVVAMTGYGQESAREQAREAGFDRHLVKPAEPQALATLLAAAPRRGQ